MVEPLVCDNGTGYIKLGYSSSTFPEYSIPNIVGRPHPDFAELVDKTLSMDVSFT
jgi:actin-related protein